MATVTTSTSTMVLISMPATAPPIHSARPVVRNPLASARPPPNSSSTPQGTFRAASQSSANSPRAREIGTAKSSSAAVSAMIVSSSGRPVSFANGLRRIQQVAAPRKTMPTSFSPRDMLPSAASSFSTTPRGSSMAMRWAGNSRRVRISQVTGNITATTGTPSSIQSKKLISIL